MALRLLSIALVVLGFFLFRQSRRSKKRRDQLLRLLRRERRLSFRQLSERVGHAGWLSTELSRLRSEGLLVVQMPESFDDSRPREDQVEYRPTAVRSARGF